MNTDLIDKIPLFMSVPADERQRLIEIFHPIEYPPGSIIIREGDHGENFFIIIGGEVDIIKALGSPEERSFGIRTLGDFIGEMSLIEKHGIRSATVRARNTVHLLSINRAEFNIMLQRWPNLAIEMLHEMSVRLRTTEQATIRDLQEKNIELTKAYTELKAAHEQIIEKEKLEKELQVARRIQSSFLPQELPIFPGYEFGARILPARAVGGDLYDFIPLSKKRLGVLIGDVSDKCIPAALFMALTRSILRVEATRTLSPVKLLQKVNHHLLEMNKESMFVTVLYGVLDQDSGEFHYARAGHEIPVLIGPDFQPIDRKFNSGQMLGIFSNPLIDEQVVTLQPGGTLLLYTDGATDAIDEINNPFERTGLISQLIADYHLPPQQITDRLINAIIIRQGDKPQFDDITILAVRARNQ